MQQPSAEKQAARANAPEHAEGERGTELELTTSHDTEQLVCASGALFLVTNRQGDVEPRGARELGLFYRDTRYLSYLKLSVLDAELVHLSADASHDAYNQIDVMVGDLAEGQFLDDPQNFLHVRRRQLLDHAFAEEITLTNFLGRAIRVTVTLHFDVDFADIFEVRGAKRPRRGVLAVSEPSSEGIVYAYTGLDGASYRSTLRFAPTPRELRPGRADFSLDLPASGSARICLTVLPCRDERAPEPPPRSFDARVQNVAKETSAFRERSTQVRCDNPLIQRFLDQAVSDLHALSVQVGTDRIVAAGIPWFCCPFGRDALIASYETLLLNPELAKGSLRVLAAYQGKRFDDVTEEEPGKIFHELRFGEMVAAGELPHSPYYGTIDATPLFVIVAHHVLKVTNDVPFLDALLPHLKAALAWIDARSENGTTLVRYARRSERGLDNQGWKDSKAGVSFPSGERAAPPIALCEIQGYCVDAYERGARILAALGEPALAGVYARRGEAMRGLVDEALWLPAEGRYAYAVDGRGRRLDTVVSNLGHLLWSRVPSADRARRTADVLLEHASFSGFGVRTLAEGQPVYNPLSYHNGTIWPHDNALVAKGMANYGLTGHATAIFEGLVDAMAYFPNARLPELFCGMPKHSGNLVRYPVACSPQAWAAGAPFLLLQAILGLHADAPARRLSIRNASLPPSVEWVMFEGLRIGDARVDVRLRRVNKRVHVDRFDVSGGALHAEIQLE